MKLARFAGDTDIEDASLLLRKLRAQFEDVEDVWSFVGGLVPVAKRGQARHNLDVLWEMLDESAWPRPCSDDLAVRQFVKDATREAFSWATAPAPDFPGKRARAVYASLVELLAMRAGETLPAWTSNVGKAPAPVFLVRAARRSKAMRRESLTSTPEALTNAERVCRAGLP